MDAKTAAPEPPTEGRQRAQEAGHEHFDFVGQLLGSLTAQLWRHSWSKQRVSATLGRYSAHLAILALAVAVGFASRIEASSVVEASRPAGQLASPDSGVAATDALSAPATEGYRSATRAAITRAANYLTTIPERERLEVITYTVQEGDNIFSIAEAFKLSPYTVVWSNMEILQGAPWLLQPGLPLYILPADGAYHTVRAGETIGAIADDYEVSPEALINEWNTISPDAALAEGTLLVVPGGIGPDFDWEPPRPPPQLMSLSRIEASQPQQLCRYRPQHPRPPTAGSSSRQAPMPSQVGSSTTLGIPPISAWTIGAGSMIPSMPLTAAPLSLPAGVVGMATWSAWIMATDS